MVIMARRWLLFILAVAVPAVAGAQDAYRDARVRYVEPGVSMQRASETGAEEALPNLPFLPGDRIWTDQSGRAEFQFADGTVLRVDRRSKLDYVARDDGRGEHVVLRLWSGGLYVHGRDPEVTVESPGGLIEITRGGVYRIDVDSGETRLSVYEGEAELDSTRVRSGERVYARRGEAIEGPQRFDRVADDEFARWNDQRGEREAWADTRRPDYLPEEIAPYAGELEANGAWYYEAEIGNVWRPHVGPGWAPYSDGRWVWTAYGWTWVPFEGWGWAPSHYGRWGHSARLGWYWIPSAGWGPAWVSWAVGPSYVGWCPLGYRDRPVLVYERGDRGRAVPRGSVAAANPTATNPWTFVRRGDLNARDLGRRRVDAGPEIARDVRVVESPRVRLTRDIQLSDERAAARNVRTRPGVGDTVPELRSDPMVTIRAPLPRTHYESEREREREAERRRPIRYDERTVIPPAGRSHPTDVRSAPAEGVAVDRPRGEERRAEPPQRTESPDREVMRPVFRPLSRPEQERPRPARESGEARSGAERRRPESAPRAQPESQPRSQRPPEARPAPQSQSRERAVPRKKDN
jgi:FecR protein